MNGPDWRECQQYLDEQQFREMMLASNELIAADVDYDKWAAQLEAEEEDGTE